MIYKYFASNTLGNGFSSSFHGEEVINMLDCEGEDGGLEEDVFPGSDEEFGIEENEM